MGEKFEATKTKDKTADFNRSTRDFSGIKKGKIGAIKNPAVVVVKTMERRNELKKIFDENGWSCRIKIRPDQEEDIRDLESLQRVGVTVVNETATKRNDPCPCGSGKKYKKCCFAK